MSDSRGDIESKLTDIAYEAERLYRKHKDWPSFVYEITEISKVNISKYEAEMIWRAIDAYSDLNE